MPACAVDDVIAAEEGGVAAVAAIATVAAIAASSSVAAVTAVASDTGRILSPVAAGAAIPAVAASATSAAVAANHDPVAIDRVVVRAAVERVVAEFTGVENGVAAVAAVTASGASGTNPARIPVSSGITGVHAIGSRGAIAPIAAVRTASAVPSVATGGHPVTIEDIVIVIAGDHVFAADYRGGSTGPALSPVKKCHSKVTFYATSATAAGGDAIAVNHILAAASDRGIVTSADLRCAACAAV
ncbi:hypothetical protein [Ovoidimarina sediminis]|uniref:hypothetical protein n=1 Tax=Ovoidimarina sediminis TaxID=3079856 RepID=UPI00290FFB18|nr:hypothetical protein [Rhodophyticola sp. MJ-SS7]MDU8945071.1 hypothetical protein [Rhodophyticola sp. MJ-SS7]